MVLGDAEILESLVFVLQYNWMVPCQVVIACRQPDCRLVVLHSQFFGQGEISNS